MDKYQENNSFKKRSAKQMLVLFFVLFFCASFIYFAKSNSIKKPEVDSKPQEVFSKNNTGQEIRILFLGDLMFDRYIRQVQARKGGEFIFSGVKNILSESDLVVGNLEGPITDNQSISVDTEVGSKENYIFTFDPKFSKLLADGNIRLVNIGNNHIYNFGKEGIDSTRKYLTNSGVRFFGDPEDRSGKVAIENIKGRRVAFVNYNQFISGGEQKSLGGINRAKNEKADLIIVYAHWGTEFALEPASRIKNLAHGFIDGGADLIIGSHPHVVQPREEYKNKKIYYSLGNFVFDQYFDPNTEKGLSVMANVDPYGKMQFEEFYVRMKSNGQTVLAEN